MLELIQVSKVYPNGAVALRDVGLYIKQGEFVFLVGPSGAGKSTLVKMVICEELPTRGQIVVNGQNITRLKQRHIPYLRRTIGVVFQDYRLLRRLTVYENVAFAMQVIEAPLRQIRKRVPETLQLVGLEHKTSVYPDELSGGEKQRVSLARAIVNKPGLLIADEPTGNLDPQTSWNIMNLLLDINLGGTTVVMATHDRDIVDALQKRVVVINNGLLVRDDRRGGYVS